MTKEENRREKWNAYCLRYYYLHRDEIRKKKALTHYSKKDRGELVLLKEKTKRRLALMGKVLGKGEANNE